MDEFVTLFRRESRRLQAAAVEPECADITVCDSKYALVTGVVILSHYFHLDSSWYEHSRMVPSYINFNCYVIIIISLIRQVGSNKRKIQIKYKIQNKQTTIKQVRQ